jgi:hypothetical protein
MTPPYPICHICQSVIYTTYRMSPICGNCGLPVCDQCFVRGQNVCEQCYKEFKRSGNVQNYLRLEQNMEEWEENENRWHKLVRGKNLLSASFWLVISLYLANQAFDKIGTRSLNPFARYEVWMIVIGVFVAMFYLIMEFLKD